MPGRKILCDAAKFPGAAMKTLCSQIKKEGRKEGRKGGKKDSSVSVAPALSTYLYTVPSLPHFAQMHWPLFLRLTFASGHQWWTRKEIRLTRNTKATEGPTRACRCLGIPGGRRESITKQTIAALLYCLPGK